MGKPSSSSSRVVVDLVVVLPQAVVATVHLLVSLALLQAMHLCMWGCLCIRGCPARLALWRAWLLCGVWRLLVFACAVWAAEDRCG